MRRIFPTLCVLFFICTSLFGQIPKKPIKTLNPITVVINIIEILDKEDNNEEIAITLRKVLEDYKGGAEIARNILIQLNMDPTILNGRSDIFVKSGLAKKGIIEDMDDDIGNEINSNKSAFSVNAVADGIAKFLVKRTKEELGAAFFSQFQDQMDLHPTMNALFPVTKGSLNSIGQDIYRFQAFIESIRESFIIDLKTMPGNLSNYLDSLTLIKDPLLKSSVQDLLYATQLLTENSDIPKVFEFLGGTETNTYRLGIENSKKVHDAFHFLSLICNWLKSPEYFKKEKIWIDQNTLSKIVASKNGNIVTRVLMTEVIRSHNFFEEKKYKQFVENDLKKVSMFLKLGNEIQRHLKVILDRSENEDEMPDYSDYYPFFQSVTKLLRLATSYLDENQELTKVISNTIDVFDFGNTLILALKQKQYATAVMSISMLLSGVLKEEYDNCYKQSFLKYGTFIAVIAKSQDSDEIAKAIEAVALPVGSSSIKRNSAFNVSLNGYTGLTYGGEKLIYQNGSNGKKGNLAVSAPVGVAVSRSILNGNSLTLYATIIDVGALTSFRFNDTNTNELPELKWQNIFAPGGYLIFGFKNTPISIGAGIQIGPILRSVTSSGIELETNSSFRYGINATVDIPIINFYTKGKKFDDCSYSENQNMKNFRKKKKKALTRKGNKRKIIKLKKIEKSIKNEISKLNKELHDE